MIGYSDATVPFSNHAIKGLIRFFRAPSVAQKCEISFTNCFYLISIINGQSSLAQVILGNQIGPKLQALYCWHLARMWRSAGRDKYGSRWQLLDRLFIKGKRRTVFSQRIHCWPQLISEQTKSWSVAYRSSSNHLPSLAYYSTVM